MSRDSGNTKSRALDKPREVKYRNAILGTKNMSGYTLSQENSAKSTKQTTGGLIRKKEAGKQRIQRYALKPLGLQRRSRHRRKVCGSVFCKARAAKESRALELTFSMRYAITLTRNWQLEARSKHFSCFIPTTSAYQGQL